MSLAAEENCGMTAHARIARNAATMRTSISVKPGLRNMIVLPTTGRAAGTPACRDSDPPPLCRARPIFATSDVVPD